MLISKDLINSFINVTSKAAIEAFKFVGMKNKTMADKAAVDIMREELNKLDIDGKIVIGEGELDKAPMLYIGEKLGTGKGISIDIAVDPVEGTNFVANNLPGGSSIIFLCLGLSKIHALTFETSLFLASAILKIFSFIELSRSTASLGMFLLIAILFI